MSIPDTRPHVLRDALIGVLVIVVGSAILAFAGIPTRVSLVEASQTDIKKSLDKMDSKIDLLVQRRHQ